MTTSISSEAKKIMEWTNGQSELKGSIKFSYQGVKRENMQTIKDNHETFLKTRSMSFE